jgi:uncharacterized membrane protein
MDKNRLEAFSDGIIGVAITLMVLELKPPALAGGLANLSQLGPPLLTYVLSFVYIGIYWNNHHHMFQAVRRVDGAILWANLHLLFWITLFPFTTAWWSEHLTASEPTAVYGFVLLMAAIAYYILQTVLIGRHGRTSILASAVGEDWKGKLSPAIYLSGIGLAFVNPLISDALYVTAALIWLVPDRRIERALIALDDQGEPGAGV